MNRVLLAVVLLLALVLSGCGGEPVSGKPSPRVSPPLRTPGPSRPVYPEGRELLASAETEEEARELAELYGVELVSFSGHIAVFHTEEDPFEVIRRGEKNDWPPLEINRSRQAFSKP